MQVAILPPLGRSCIVVVTSKSSFTTLQWLESSETVIHKQNSSLPEKVFCLLRSIFYILCKGQICSRKLFKGSKAGWKPPDRSLNFTGGRGGAEFSPLNATSYNPGVFLFLMKGLIRRKGLIESEHVAFTIFLCNYDISIKVHYYVQWQQL